MYFLKIIDVSPFLLETFSAGDGPNELNSRVLKSQITSEYDYLFSTPYMLILKSGISWSKQADFGLVPPLPLDGSLLVTGSRAGFLTLLRLLHNSSTFRTDINILADINLIERFDIFKAFPSPIRGSLILAYRHGLHFPPVAVRYAL